MVLRALALFPVVPDSNPVLASGLALFPVVPGSNPVPASGLALFPVVPGSTLPCVVNSQLVASFQLGFLIMFLLNY